MWLSGQSKPGHDAIDDFGGKGLQGHPKKIFHQVALLLVEQGAISSKGIFVDGTKMEANANRHAFAWGKSMRTSKERIEKQLKELQSYVEKAYKDEQHLPNTPDLEAVDADKIEATINQINDALKGKDIDGRIKQKLNHAKEDWPTNMARHQKQEAILKERNGYCKTEKDASSMRMKDDHMKNGQLKPAYDDQASTNNQYFTNCTLAQTTADTTTLKDHLNDHIESYRQTPGALTADAGHGSEENHTDLEDKEITACVKYDCFHKERQDKRKGKTNPFHPDQSCYNEDTDTHHCPMGQALTNMGNYEERTKNGFEQTMHRYQVQNCNGCPLRGPCHESKHNRIVERNYDLMRLKGQSQSIA